jgi:membrane protein implicated in regulation of membrane protease activity
MMDAYWWWAVAGIALIIAELITGTFYLVVIGIAALAGAAIAFYGFSFWVQAEIAAVVAIAGVILVTRFRKTQASAPGRSLDVGQSVVLDAWISEKDRLARVRYRNTLWDARLLDAQGAEAGHVLYITRVEGNTLHVSTTRPA